MPDTERNFYRIEPRIRALVTAVNEIGIETNGSCQGHMEKTYPYPWITLALTPYKNHPLLKTKVTEFGILIPTSAWEILGEKQLRPRQDVLDRYGITKEYDDGLFYGRVSGPPSGMNLDDLRKMQESASLLALFLSEGKPPTTSS